MLYMKNLEMFNQNKIRFLCLLLCVWITQVFTCGFVNAQNTNSTRNNINNWTDNAWASWDEHNAGVALDLGISKTLMNYLDTMKQDDYLKRLYQNSFSMNPFNDIVQETRNMATERNLWGIESISKTLWTKWCYITNDSISAILYTFSEQFSKDMTLQVAQNSKNVVNSVPDRKRAENACFAFIKCYYPNTENSNIMNKCRDEILKMYNLWYSQTDRFQQVETVQVGEDRFWNWNSKDKMQDSPFDLLYDMSSLARLLFEDVEESFVIAFYHMPNFRWEGDKKGWDGSNGLSWNEWESNNAGDNGETGDGVEWWNGLGMNDGNVLMDGEFSKFLDIARWNNQVSVSDWNNWDAGNNEQVSIGWDRCAIEWVNDDVAGKSDVADRGENLWDVSINDVSQVEIADYLEGVKNQIDGALSQLKKWNVVDNAEGEDGKKIKKATQKTLEEAKTCYDTCEWLRIDKKLACQVMCTCDVWESEMWDPMEYPGLWPILSVKYCAVPTQNHYFDSEGIIIYSFEKIINELYGILDALDRSWELGIFEKQKEMLDSSAINLDFAKMFTFTVEQQIKKLASKAEKDSQAQQIANESTNEQMKKLLRVSPSLEDVWYLNSYTLIQDAVAMNTENNFSANQYMSLEQSKIDTLSGVQAHLMDQIEVLRDEKNVKLWMMMDDFLLRHLRFWVEATKYFEQFEGVAKAFLGKKW